MTKQPEDWLDDVPGDDVEDEDDEIIWVSKSEIKRDAEELKRLGAELVKKKKNALDKIPLDLGKTRWIRSRWIPTCATPSNSPSESKKRVAAASCSLSARCCATAMSIRFVRRWTS